jgi:hypothetical protein
VLLFLAASTLVAAHDMNPKRGLQAIATELLERGDTTSAHFEDADMVTALILLSLR